MRKTAKEEMLFRIRTALVNAPDPPERPQSFRQRDKRDRTVLVEDFIGRVEEYKAVVTRTDDARLSQALADACRTHAIHRLVVSADVPTHWLPTEVTVLRDDPPLILVAKLRRD